jgi:5-methylcytosine-specific restriction endonuclease McrA
MSTKQKASDTVAHIKLDRSGYYKGISFVLPDQQITRLYDSTLEEVEYLLDCLVRIKSQLERRRDYLAYLESEAWETHRLAAIERAEGRCQLCSSSDDLQVHHRTYERLFNEAPGDLTVLCGACHKRHHDAMRAR